METKITEDDFYEKYKPQVNHIVGEQEASFSGCMYETYGEELQYILSMANNLKTKNRVWTIVESDGEMSFVAGYHLVNRIGYLITERFFKNENNWVELDNDFN